MNSPASLSHFTSPSHVELKSFPNVITWFSRPSCVSKSHPSAGFSSLPILQRLGSSLWPPLAIPGRPHPVPEAQVKRGGFGKRIWIVIRAEYGKENAKGINKYMNKNDDRATAIGRRDVEVQLPPLAPPFPPPPLALSRNNTSPEHFRITGGIFNLFIRFINQTHFRNDSTITSFVLFVCPC